jgi:hypothetical protein
MGTVTTPGMSVFPGAGTLLRGPGPDLLSALDHHLLRCGTV